MPSAPSTGRSESDDRDNNNSEAEAPSTPPLRRSKRDLNAIKLGGRTGNQCFVQRLAKLFFRQRTTTEEVEAILLAGANRRSINSSSNDNDTTMKVSRATPRRQVPIYVLDNFLTEAELKYFDDKIRSSLEFQRSFVDNMNYDNDEEQERGEDMHADDEGKHEYKKKRKRKQRTVLDDSQRTSTFYPFRKLQDTKVAALEQRIANLLGCWVHQIEPLQLVRYEPGQFFGVHHDMGDLKDDDTVELPKKDLAVKRRLVTIFCYLNTLENGQGGATYFPKCGNLRVRPVRGRAVLWSNVTEDGQPDERTIHAGEAVVDNRKVAAASDTTVKGSTKRSQRDADLVKYGLNIWICEE